MVGKVTALVLLFVFACTASGSASAQSNPSDTSLKLTTRPKPMYTDVARKKKLEGVVRLRIEFLATGEIGEIVDVTKKNRERLQKLGLTDQAIIAARKIQFTPAIKDGIAITVSRVVEYTFTIY